MTELHWLPDQIGRLTIWQLCCLFSEKPFQPGQQQQIKTAEDYEAMTRQQKEQW